MSIILTPKISEKAIAFAAAFKVDVVDVRMLITKGKVKTFKQVKGTQKNVKKAMVKLKSGQTIALFEGAK
jgi:ribosomal protein L23